MYIDHNRLDCRLPHHTSYAATPKFPEIFLTEFSENFLTKISCTLFFAEKNSSSERQKTLGWRRRQFLFTGLDRGLGSTDLAVEELEVEAGGGRVQARGRGRQELEREDGGLAGTQPRGRRRKGVEVGGARAGDRWELE
jgi:hypothetical protein